MSHAQKSRKRSAEKIRRATVVLIKYWQTHPRQRKEKKRNLVLMYH
jgi:hypothetical protein